MFHRIQKYVPVLIAILLSTITPTTPSFIPQSETTSLRAISESDLSSQSRLEIPSLGKSISRNHNPVSRKSMNATKTLSRLFQPRAINGSGEAAFRLVSMLERVDRIKRFSRLIGVVMKLENCDSSQCNNGATCLTNVLYEGGFECICKTGFYGPLCDQTSEDCMYNPCHNGGMCMAVYEGYICGCPPTHSGIHCEILLEKKSDAWYKDLGLDKYLSLTSFSAFVAAMFGLLLFGTLCCFVENKKAELRQRNKQFQKISETIGMKHLSQEEFVNHGYLNATSEVFIDLGYKATGLVASLLGLPHVLRSFLKTRRLRQAKKLEGKISRYYRKEKKRSEWWDLYMKTRDRMRREEIEAIVGEELNKALEQEVDKIRRDQELEKRAAVQLEDISRQIDAKTEVALDTMDTKVPMTTMKEIALEQGTLPKSLVEMIVNPGHRISKPGSHAAILTDLETDGSSLSSDTGKITSPRSSLAVESPTVHADPPKYPKIPPPPPPPSSSSSSRVTSTQPSPKLNFFQRKMKDLRRKVKDMVGGDELMEKKRAKEELKRRMAELEEE